MNKISLKFKIQPILGMALILCYGGAFDGLASNKFYSTPAKIPVVLEAEVFKIMNITTKQYLWIHFLVQPVQNELFFGLVAGESELKWTLFHRGQNQAGMLNDDTIEEEGSKVHIGDVRNVAIFSSSNPEKGLYSAKILAPANDHFGAFFSLNLNRSCDMFDLADSPTHPRLVSTKVNLSSSKCLFGWPMQHTKLPDAQLIFVISTLKPYRFVQDLPTQDENLSAKSVDPSYFYYSEDVTSKNNISIGDLIVGKTYYVTLLLTNKFGLCVLYARKTLFFGKFRNSKIKDGELFQNNFPINGDKLYFKYKVTRRRYQNYTGPLVWYVRKCCGTIFVEIKHKKKTLQQKLVRGFGLFEIDNLVPNDRYVMKITDVSKDPSFKFNHLEVLATMRPDINPKLLLPLNLNVTARQRITPKNETVAVISWHPITSDRSIQYCIYFKEIRHKLTPDWLEYAAAENQCNFNATELSYQLDVCNYKNYPTYRRSVLKRTLRGFNHDRDYLVQITAKKHRSKVTVIYNLLAIPRTEKNA